MFFVVLLSDGSFVGHIQAGKALFVCRISPPSFSSVEFRKSRSSSMIIFSGLSFGLALSTFSLSGFSFVFFASVFALALVFSESDVTRFSSEFS